MTIVEAHGEGVTALGFEYEVSNGRWAWSHRLRELHGLGPHDDATTEILLQHMDPDDRPIMLARFHEHLTHPGPYSCSYRMTDAGGCTRRIIFVGRSVAVAGTVESLTGFVVDITEPAREIAREAVTASAEHRAAIEQAKGALMLSLGIDEDAAFNVLRVYSSRTNRKLAQIAEVLTASLAAAGATNNPVNALLEVLRSMDQGVRTAAGPHPVAPKSAGQHASVPKNTVPA